MKKILCLTLVLITLFTLCACSGSGTKNSSEDLESRARSTVETHVRMQVVFGFEDAQPYQVDVARLTSTGENEWETSGRASFKDKYGDVYGGKFDGTVTYNPITDDFDVDLELEDSFRRQ